MNSWDELSMAEKADIMKLAVQGGVYDLDAIRNGYNEFAKGGNIYSGEEEGTQQMEVSRSPHIDLAISNPWLYQKLHPAQRKVEKYEPTTFAGRITQLAGASELGQKYADYTSSVIQQVPVVGLVPSALDLGYDTNRLYHNPSLTATKDVALDAASLVPALRKTMKGWWMKGNSGSFITEAGQIINNPRVASTLEVALQPFRTAINTGVYGARAADFLDDSKAYLKEMYNSSKIGKHFPIKALGGPLIEAAMNEYRNGGKIHIKPENRGKFTALKKRTGHSASWFKAHGTPAQKKMATFAINAAKWKHDDGGKLFSGEEESSQQMQLGRNYWINQDAHPEWGSSTTIDGGALPEIVVTPTNDAAWLFSIGKYQHNPRKPLADKHTRKVVSNYLSKFDNESAKDYNARISRLADVLDIRGVQFKKNDVKSGKLKGRAHYIDQSATAYIDNMEDIFAEVAHPWQYAKGNNNIEREVGTGKYDSDSDPRGGTRYAYPDTAEGETHAFFEPVLTEWIETGKIGKSSPILNNELSRQKIKPKDRMEVGDSASSWDRQAIERRLLANPDQLPLHKRIQYSLFDYPLLDKKKAFGGNLFDGEENHSQQMKIGKPYYSYDENGRKIDDTLNYNIGFPEIVITPDSRKSPAERAILERERRRAHDAYFGNGTYNAKLDKEQTELEKAASNNVWKNSFEGKFLDRGKSITSGVKTAAGFIPVTGDIIQGLDATKDAISGDYLSAGLGFGMLAVPNLIEKPLKYLGKGIKSVFELTDNQWDEMYNAAIKANDMEEAQRLRDLHFMAKAPDTAIANEGLPIHAYHGTGKQFNEFDTTGKYSTLDEGYYGVGAYFAPNKEIADMYADTERTPIVYDTYLNIKDPLRHVRDENADLYGKPIVGNDGVISVLPDDLVDPDFDMTEFVATKPNQIKKADVITYDDAGNIIPLSQRDNFALGDMRYGLIPFGIGLTGYGLFNNQEALGGKIKKRKR